MVSRPLPFALENGGEKKEQKAERKRNTLLSTF